jgi:tetratricopeptide (TPR) repeat protein
LSRAHRGATADTVLAAARAQSHGGRPDEALATLNAAEPWPPEHAFDRLELRADCRLMLLALDEAEADARAMLTQAKGGSAAQQARAWCALARVQVRRESAEAAASAQRALALARRARQPDAIANALLCEALASWQRHPALGLQRAEQAAALFERAGDLRGLSVALRVQGAVRLQQVDTPEHSALLRRAIDAAREAGDKAAESRAVNSLYSGAGRAGR